MRKLFVAMLATAMVFGVAEASPTYSENTPIRVQKYSKKDGTSVSEHYRAKPGHGCGGSGCNK